MKDASVVVPKASVVWDHTQQNLFVESQGGDGRQQPPRVGTKPATAAVPTIPMSDDSFIIKIQQGHYFMHTGKSGKIKMAVVKGNIAISYK